MKSLLVMALFATTPAMAVTIGGGGSDTFADEPVVRYFSWCDGNSVVGQDKEGNLYVRANCDEGGLQCKSTQTYRSHGSIVTATCVAK
ncbi:hypothetical protein [Bdellovibrio sp. HCB337]|uniref:hypothetical protein n=1 Tax=Bdellovibrio sp. HCB337 TaxID=3394358 RepID=UPI0039A4DEE1